MLDAIRNWLGRKPLNGRGLTKAETHAYNIGYAHGLGKAVEELCELDPEELGPAATKVLKNLILFHAYCEVEAEEPSGQLVS